MGKITHISAAPGEKSFRDNIQTFLEEIKEQAKSEEFDSLIIITAQEGRGMGVHSCMLSHDQCALVSELVLTQAALVAQIAEMRVNDGYD